jgi:hypothetical protein
MEPIQCEMEWRIRPVLRVLLVGDVPNLANACSHDVNPLTIPNTQTASPLMALGKEMVDYLRGHAAAQERGEQPEHLGKLHNVTDGTAGV